MSILSALQPQPQPLQPSREECAANAASIRAIPLRFFAADHALAERVRAWLAGSAEDGAEVYAYQPAPGRWIEPRWLVWIRTANPQDEMRHLPSECAALYVAARAHAWLAADAGQADGEVR